MTYFDLELKTTLIFAVVAVIVGYVSFIINHTAGAALFAITVFAVFAFVLKKAFKIQEEKKWWGSVGVVYFILWLVIWTIMYNYVLM